MVPAPLALITLTLILSAKQVSGFLYGIAYTPFRTFGVCPSEEEVKEDFGHIVKYTKRIRLYSTECISVNRVALHYATTGHLSVLMGVWIDNRSTDQQEIDNLMSALQEFPHANLAGITVGNEVLYRNTMSASQVAQRIIEVKQKVRALGEETGGKFLKTAPVFGVEVFPNVEITAVSDAIGANIHPFYRTDLMNSGDIEKMMSQAVDKAIEQIKLYEAFSPGKPVIVTEIGWPTMSDVSEPHWGSDEMAHAFMKNLSIRCQEEGLEYYWFEFFDSDWKKQIYPYFSSAHSEFHWGIFNSDRVTPKAPFQNLWF